MKSKAVFLDRDGVINKNLFDEITGLKSPKKASQFILLPRVIEAIKILRKMKLKIVIVSNQPGVAFGKIKEKDLDEMTKKMKSKIKVDNVYYCKHHPNYSDCSCRKPKEGMLRKAAKELNVDISKSYMAGDRLTDIKGRKTFLVGYNFNTARQIKETGIKADYYVYDLYEAAKIIRELEVG